MAWGLPKLPGLTFSDPTKSNYHLNSNMRFYQGYRFYNNAVVASGGGPTDTESNAFALTDDSVIYDPSLTYGRVKQPALPQVIPHWSHYDKRCLNFTAFFKEPVYDSAIEKYRVRIVNIIYFLEDDTMLVCEPKVRNSGLWQGKLVKRNKIPKSDTGTVWHWKDLDVGKDICIYGRVYHTLKCDLFTKEWLESQGIELSTEEELPEDEFMKQQFWKKEPVPYANKKPVDNLRRYLEYDGKVLRFDVVWDNRDCPYGELLPLKLYYFLQDDRISINECHDGRGGRDPFPVFLKKMKLPKQWKERPVSFPSTVLEVTDEEVTEYYSPRDFVVGSTIFVLGRRMLICDCDPFTRHYYKSMLNYDQPPRIEVKSKTAKEFAKSYPPHIGIGTPEDSLQSCFGLEPKRPYKDIIKYNLNANKYLRYLCELISIHPEDKGRQFILFYSLADGTVRIEEVKRRNSGRKESRFLKALKLQLPESDSNFPTYYTPDKFYIGAVIPVFKHRFKITGCDLYVYNYMSANPDKFPPNVVDNVRNYHMHEGNLKNELEMASRHEKAETERKQLEQIGKAAVAEPSVMEKCLTALNVQEGSATPLGPPTPDMTTDIISYDDTLRLARPKTVCEDVVPLKGILKSGAAATRDDQKVVCFTGPAAGESQAQEKQRPYYPPGQQPHYDDDPDFCNRFRAAAEEERKRRQARGECLYEIKPTTQAVKFDKDDEEKPKLPGYLGKYGVDCKQIPEYMRLPSDAYEKVKKLRRKVVEIAPAATAVAGHPRLPAPDVDACLQQPPEDKPGVESEKDEDVSFACPHVKPKMPCCDPVKKPEPCPVIPHD